MFQLWPQSAQKGQTESYSDACNRFLFHAEVMGMWLNNLTVGWHIILCYNNKYIQEIVLTNEGMMLTWSVD